LRKGLIVLNVAGLVVTAAIVVVFVRRERPYASAPTIPAPPASAAAPLARSETTRPLHLADQSHVDVLDAYAAAKSAALDAEPGAELFGISATGLSHGTLDLSAAPSSDGGPGGPSLLFQFDHAGVADGGARVKRHVAVEVKAGGLRITRVEGAMLAGTAEGRSLAALEEPTCPSRKAWATAVESGVPEDATATLLLRGGDGRLVWSLYLPRFPLKHREIDARTCALVQTPR
jgi:hypothetical protein